MMAKYSLTWLFTVLCLALVLQRCEVNGGKESVCYFRSWMVYREDRSKFLPQHVDVDLCSVINYAFMKVNLETFRLDGRPNDEDGLMIDELVKLKKKRADLKIFISVGGWGHEAEPRFHNMVIMKSRQLRFIQSVIAYLEKHKLDGINIDWEYPGYRESGDPRDRKRFADFLGRMRTEFNTQALGYYITLAVSGDPKKLDTAYDIPTIAKYVDWVNVMAYNLRSHSQRVTVCPTLTFGQPPTVNSSIDAWLIKGMPASKINLGLALYGKTFKLESPNENGLGAPIVGMGKKGRYSKGGGYLSYYEICAIPWTNHKMWFESGCGTAYASISDTWVAYDDQWSIRQKIQMLVNCRGLNGIAIWALDFDDFSGTSCEQGRYPLLRAANDEMKIGSMAHCEEFIYRKFSIPEDKVLNEWWAKKDEKPIYARRFEKINQKEFNDGIDIFDMVIDMVIDVIHDAKPRES